MFISLKLEIAPSIYTKLVIKLFKKRDLLNIKKLRAK